VEFDVLVLGTSEADFSLRCAALETAFTKPDQALIVGLGSQVLLSFAAAPTDYCRPTLSKSAGDADTARSRLYSIRIDVDPSAAQLSPAGLREVGVSLQLSPAGRKTVVLSGLWTATTGTGRAAFDAGIDGYANSVLSALGGTYELVEQPAATSDRPDHVLEFRRTYRERLWAEAGAALDDPDVVNQSAHFRRVRTAPGDSHLGGGGTESAQPVVRLVRVEIAYTAWVKRTVTSLPSKWESIKDWLLGVASSDFSMAGAALVEEDASFDYDDRRITARLVLLGPDGGTLLERSVTHATDDQDEEVLIPAWTGRRFSRYPYDGPTELLRTVSVVSLHQGPVSEGDARGTVRGFFALGVEGVRQGDRGRWSRGRLSIRRTLKRMGLDGRTMDVTQVDASWQRRYYEPVESGSGGAVAPVTRAGQPEPTR
jgi:hypothetical protein